MSLFKQTELKLDVNSSEHAWCERTLTCEAIVEALPAQTNCICHFINSLEIFKLVFLSALTSVSKKHLELKGVKHITLQKQINAI